MHVTGPMLRICLSDTFMHANGGTSSDESSISFVLFLSLRVGVSAAQCVESAVTAVVWCGSSSLASCLLLLVSTTSLPAQ
jgi:hypothetical protein